MEMIIRSAEITFAGVGQRLARYLASVVPAADDNRERPYSEAVQPRLQSEPMEDSRRVWTYLDARANLAQFGGWFEYLNLEAGATECQRRGEATDPCSDHDDAHCQDLAIAAS